MRDRDGPQLVPHPGALADEGLIGADLRAQRGTAGVEMADGEQSVIEQPPVPPVRREHQADRDQMARQPPDILAGR